MNDLHLDDRLAALRASVATSQPPAAVDAALAAAIAARTQRSAGAAPRPRSDSDRWLAWPLALAASIAVLSFVVRSVPPADVLPAADPRVAEGEAFLPVVPLADIEQAGSTLVVPARVPRTTLAALGLPIDPARAAEPVDAELLVRGDGAVLALRFVD